MTNKDITKTMLRISRDGALSTFDWLRDLIEVNALDREDLRSYNQELSEANERLRIRLARKYGIIEDNQYQDDFKPSKLNLNLNKLSKLANHINKAMEKENK